MTECFGPSLIQTWWPLKIICNINKSVFQTHFVWWSRENDNKNKRYTLPSSFRRFKKIKLKLISWLQWLKSPWPKSDIAAREHSWIFCLDFECDFSVFSVSVELVGWRLQLKSDWGIYRTLQALILEKRAGPGRWQVSLLPRHVGGAGPTLKTLAL